MVASGSACRALKRGASQRTHDALALGRRITRMCRKGEESRPVGAVRPAAMVTYRVGRQPSDEAWRHHYRNEAQGAATRGRSGRPLPGGSNTRSWGTCARGLYTRRRIQRKQSAPGDRRGRQVACESHARRIASSLRSGSPAAALLPSGRWPTGLHELRQAGLVSRRGLPLGTRRSGAMTERGAGVNVGNVPGARARAPLAAS